MSDVRKYCLLDVQNIVNNHLDYSEYLQLIESMAEDCGLIEISEYVKESGIKDKTLRNRIDSDKIPYIIIGKTKFIIKKLI